MRARGFVRASLCVCVSLGGIASATAADGQQVAAVSAPATKVEIIAKVEAAAVKTAEPAAKVELTSVKASAPVVTPKKPVTSKVKKSKPKKKRARRVSPTLKASVDLTRQRMTVTQSNGRSYTWKISSGRKGFHTPTGTYRPKWKTKMHYSKKYDNAPMPHSVFYNGGYAVHATYATGRLGRPASHGCIRLSPSNAKKFYNLVSKHGNARTRITIHGRTPASSTYVAKKKHYKPKKKYAYKKTYKLNSKPKYKPVYKPKYVPKKKYTWPGDKPVYRTSGDPRIKKYY